MAILNEEQEMLRDMARNWTTNESPVAAFRKVRAEKPAEGYSPDAWSTMAQMGWAGIVIPEAHGGSDFGWMSAGLVVEELGKTLTASPLVATTLAASAIVLGGSEEQKAKCAAEGKPDMQISLYDSQSAAHVQLKAGQVDSFLGTATPLTYLAENAEGGAVFEMAEGSYPAGYLAVGSSKTEKGFAEAMTAALLAIEKDGAYAAVFDKYSAANDVLPTDLIVVNGRTSGVLK